MAGTLRGSLGLKSGPLAPTSAKLTSQYLVLDHMNNHYRKINQAKSAIDNRPPKSIGSSQKVRERKERENIKKYGTSRPTSRMSVRPVSRNEYNEDDYDEANWDDPEDDDERLVYDIMRTTLKENYPRSNDATMGSGSRQRGQSPAGFNKTIRYQDHDQANALQTYYKAERRPASVRSTHSIMSAGSRTSLTGNTKKNTDGDLLQKRSHVFTEPEKPFTPRTLKSNRQSRLSEYKYYTPPPKNRKQKQDDMDQTERKMTEADTNGYRPKPKPRGSGNLGTGTLGMTGTQTLSESQLMYETLQSRDSRHYNKGGEDMVPRLDISMDKDNMKWIKEQASKAQIRQHGGVKVPMDQIEEAEKPTVNGETMREADTLNMTGSARLTKSFGTKTMTRQRMSEAEEEQRYVAFAKEVTEEVLNRGIYTDRVLKKVFDRHVEKNKGTLRIPRMRAILDKLRKDFGVSDSPVPFCDDDDDDEMRAEITLEVDPAVKNARIARHQGHEQQSEDRLLKDDSHHDHVNQQADSTLTDHDHVKQSADSTLTDHNLVKKSADSTLTDHNVVKHSANSTINSTDTFNFGSTGEAYSTVRSQQRRGSQLSEARSEIDERRSLASESRSTIGEKRSQRGDSQSDYGDRRSEMSDARSVGRQSDAGVNDELTATQTLEAYHMTMKARDRHGASRSASEVDASEKMSIHSEVVNGVKSPRELPSEPESSAMSSPSHSAQPPVPSRRRRNRKKETTDHNLPDQDKTSDITVTSKEKEEEGQVTLGDQEEVTVDFKKAIEANTNCGLESKKEESIALLSSHQGDSSSKAKNNEHEQTNEVDEYAEDDYEDDYDADDDDGQGATSHRTSDDDF